MSDPFVEPASQVRIQEFENRLMLVTPSEVLRDVATVHGVTECIVADVTLLNEDGTGESHPNMYIFPRVIQASLRPYVGTGKPVLGTLAKGIAKKGQDPPWIFADATDEDKRIARKYFAAKPRNNPAEAPF